MHSTLPIVASAVPVEVPSKPGASRLAGRLLIVLSAALLCLPCLINGVPPLGDSITHAQYQHEFSEQFWHGDYYPRWLRDANKGYGSPIFLIQYPLPYWITALLRPIFRFPPTPGREAHELGIFCFLAIAGAGLATHFWLLKSHKPLTAAMCGITYICLPYILGADLYRGVEIGQLSSFVWMPLALGLCPRRRVTFTRTCAVGFVFALLILSNVISAALFVPLLFGYGMTSGLESATRRIVVPIVMVAVGVGVAGIYVFPLLAYRHLFDLSALSRVVPGFSLSDSFIFVAQKGLSKGLIASFAITAAVVCFALMSLWRGTGHRNVRVASAITLGFGATMMVPGFGAKLMKLGGISTPLFDPGHFPDRMLVTVVLSLSLGAFAYGRVIGRAPVIEAQQTVLLVVSCSACVLMLPWSELVWKIFPGLAQSIQFPHRLCGILTLATAGLLAPAFDCSLGRFGERCKRLCPPSVLASYIVVVLGVGVLSWRPDQIWVRGFKKNSTYQIDRATGVDPMYRIYITGDNLDAFAKLIGTEPSSEHVDRTSVVDGNAQLIEGHGRLQTIWQSSRIVTLDYDVPAGGIARIQQIYSPLWKTISPGTANPMKAKDGTMLVVLSPGSHEVQVRFVTGRSEIIGRLITGLSLVLMVCLLAAECYRKIETSMAPTGKVNRWLSSVTLT